MSRNLDYCHPATKLRVRAVMAAMEAYGYPMFVVRSYDTLAKQNKLYQQGRTTPGNIVTWIKKGWHNIRNGGKPCARAVDLAFKKQKRFPTRSNWSSEWPWKRLKILAEACDLRIPLRKDKGHLIDEQGQKFSEAWAASDKE